MASSKFELGSELAQRVADLGTDLRAAAEGFQEKWDDRSENWQEGDAGTAAGAWIDGLLDVADALDNVTSEPED